MRESILRKGKALTCPVWSGGVGVDGEALLAFGEGEISNGRGARGKGQAVEDKDNVGQGLWSDNAKGETSFYL